MGQPSKTNLLTQSQFDSYTASWLGAAGGGDPLVLEQLFEQASRLLAATLPIDQLLQLVSAVGVRRLKIGFVVQPTAPQDESAFALVLYATDADNRRLSAYYLANSFWGTLATSGTPPAPAPGCAAAVPPQLASLWRQQWAAATSVEPSFFKVPDGILQGYEFEVGAFVQAMLAVPQLNDRLLRLDFGLHEFYGPNVTSVPSLTRTFGVTVSVTDDHHVIESAVYDMALPHPPAVSCAA